jgi:extracellular factor (EF) 3-hydroxypalmitic acid methyl ester biosynthesis protein
LVNRHGRTTQITTLLKSVHQVLKEAHKETDEFTKNHYDVVYCAGLFDYLSDRICKRLTAIFYDLLAPEGLMITTNVHASNPSRKCMEVMLDGHLVYRNDETFSSLNPDQLPDGVSSLDHDSTGVNVFNVVRKPK